MKNKNQLVENVIHFIKSELEVTLAVLILGAFVVGYSFAQTPEATPDTSVQQTAETSDKFVIGGRTYEGLVYHKRMTGFYRVTQISGGSVNVSPNGLTTVTDGDTYFTVNLDLPMSPLYKYYVDVDGAHIEVNGQRITDRTQALNLAGAKSIQVKTRGYATLRTISTTVPAGGSMIVEKAPIGSLYIAPTVTTLTVGSTRTFLLVAVDTNGNSAPTDGAKWSSSDNSIVEINSATGMVTAHKQGTVIVTATVGTAKASATVTVRSAEEPTATTHDCSTACPATPTAPTTTAPTQKSETSATNDAATPLFPTNLETESASAAVDKAVDNLFKTETIAARSATTGRTHPTQNEINQEAAKLPTLAQKVAFRLTTAVKDIATSLREMVSGYRISNENGEVQEKPGALQAIGQLIGRLIADPRGGNAGTLRINPDVDVD